MRNYIDIGDIDAIGSGNRQCVLQGRGKPGIKHAARLFLRHEFCRFDKATAMGNTLFTKTEGLHHAIAIEPMAITPPALLMHGRTIAVKNTAQSGGQAAFHFAIFAIIGRGSSVEGRQPGMLCPSLPKGTEYRPRLRTEHLPRPESPDQWQHCRCRQETTPVHDLFPSQYKAINM